MRSLALLFALAACGPAVSTSKPTFDEDIDADRPTHEVEPAAVAPAAAPAVEAPPGKGLRQGTIERAKLVAVLDAGPGAFLRQFEVSAQMDGDRFVGWQLVQLVDHASPLRDLDLVPGDVLLAINGQPIARPDQLQAVWDSLRKANEIEADLVRGNRRLALHFAIDPRL